MANLKKKMHQIFSIFCVACCDVSSFVTNDSKLESLERLENYYFWCSHLKHYWVFLPTHRHVRMSGLKITIVFEVNLDQNTPKC